MVWVDIVNYALQLIVCANIGKLITAKYSLEPLLTYELLLQYSLLSILCVQVKVLDTNFNCHK